MTSTGQEVGRRRGSPWGKALVILLAWACLTGILSAVGVWVTHSSSVNGLDRHVTSVVVAHRTPVLDAVMKAVTWLGSWVALVATGILLVVLVFRRRLPVAVLLLATVAWAGEAGGVTLAKHVVHRSRPPQDVRLVSAHGWSWPSGHTAIAMVVFTTLALVVTAIAPGPAYRTFAWVLGTLAVVAVAFSRVELGVHWSTDVIASMVFVATWFLVLTTVLATVGHPKTMRPTGTSPAQVRDDG
jgi:membrane-associated phospholipid phosphatase